MLFAETSSTSSPQVRGLACLTFLADPATRRQLGQLYQVR